MNNEEFELNLKEYDLLKTKEDEINDSLKCYDDGELKKDIQYYSKKKRLEKINEDMRNIRGELDPTYKKIMEQINIYLSSDSIIVGQPIKTLLKECRDKLDSLMDWRISYHKTIETYAEQLKIIQEQIKEIKVANARRQEIQEQNDFEEWVRSHAEEYERDQQQRRQQELIDSNKDAADNMCRSCKNFYCLNRYKLTQPICSMFEPTFRR